MSRGMQWRIASCICTTSHRLFQLQLATPARSRLYATAGFTALPQPHLLGLANSLALAHFLCLGTSPTLLAGGLPVRRFVTGGRRPARLCAGAGRLIAVNSCLFAFAAISLQPAVFAGGVALPAHPAQPLVCAAVALQAENALFGALVAVWAGIKACGLVALEAAAL